MSRRRGQIYAEVLGEGPDVVMIHGWGMHGGVWRVFAECLAASFRVTLIDLPGHGRSGMVADFDLDGVGAALLEVAPARAHWLGWSLGAAIALNLAHRCPERVASLVMMAGSARFARSEDWPHAMDPEVLAKFARDMMDDCHHTLLRFLGLQVWGLEHSRELMKELRHRVEECEEPDADALKAGLAILQTADLRSVLAALRLPLLLLMGARDRLVPHPAGHAMADLASNAELCELEAAGHVPFLTHPEACAHALHDFWCRHEYAA